MATQTIVIDRVVLINKLKSVLDEKQKEHDLWLEDSKTYKQRRDDWDQKAQKYIVEHGVFDEGSVNTGGNFVSVRIEVPLSELVAVIGERPDNNNPPTFFTKQYYKGEIFTPAEEVKNAVVLYELSTEPTVKVNMKTSWAIYL